MSAQERLWMTSDRRGAGRRLQNRQIQFLRTSVLWFVCHLLNRNRNLSTSELLVVYLNTITHWLTHGMSVVFLSLGRNPSGSFLKETLAVQRATGCHSFSRLSVFSSLVLVLRPSVRGLLYKLFSAIRTDTPGQVCTHLGCSTCSRLYHWMWWDFCFCSTDDKQLTIDNK